jgi:hypothetical protein
MISCEHQGRKYEIRFHHYDVRFLRRFEDVEVEVKGPEGEVVGTRMKRRVVEITPLTLKQQKKLGGNKTTVLVLDVTDPANPPVLVKKVTAKHHASVDPYMKAHARWYALDAATLDLDDRLRRALWKAYYESTSWRPDGSDGFKQAWVKRTKSGLSQAVKRELVRWTPRGGYQKSKGMEVVGSGAR